MDVPGSDYLVVAVLVGGGITLLIHGLLALRGRLAPATEQ
jgi:hypothetical protein